MCYIEYYNIVERKRKEKKSLTKRLSSSVWGYDFLKTAIRKVISKQQYSTKKP